MKQAELFAPVSMERFEILSKEELIILAKEHQRLIHIIQKDNENLRALNDQLKQRTLFVEDQFITIKNKLFGKSSERIVRGPSLVKKSKVSGSRHLLPSERYPEAPLIERHITIDTLPPCSCCGKEMPDSGMTEESQYLTKIPAQFYVIVQVRHKYACKSCHGDIKTAPAEPRITPGGSYSDELIIETAVNKFCDLVPIGRQVKVAERSGIKGLPPQSLIEGTHQLADFLKAVYLKLKAEVLASRWLHADETPHRMLEGDVKSNWYLWGFSTKVASYFECHDTRSGDVASDFLLGSVCEYLVSDVYSGYSKAIGVTNVVRLQDSKPLIKSIFCNAHARRYFKQAGESFPDESKYYISQYRKIYILEGLATKYPDKKEKIRLRLRKYFEKIQSKCMQEVAGYSNKSSLAKAMNYFLKNYVGFTRFIEHLELPIDNNPAERLLRSPVIGRKTWYGTHSKRGSETAAILFSIIESCKLNKVNPSEYLKNLVQNLHQGQNPYTPSEYKCLVKN